MIVLDTNVVSEPVRHGDPAVLAWLDRQPAETLFLTTISLAELLVGVELLPDGRRRHMLAAALKDTVAALFGDRILPFDGPAASAYASLYAQARRNGETISIADGQIAAIAHVHGFAVATRDIRPFRAAGVPVFDPWQA